MLTRIPFRRWVMTTVLLVLSGCGAAAALLAWRSHVTGDLLQWQRRSHSQDWGVERNVGLVTGNGRLAVRVYFSRILVTGMPVEWTTPGTTWRHRTQRPDLLIDLGWSRSALGRMGFVLLRPPPYRSNVYRSSQWLVGLPLWAIAIVCLLLPTRQAYLSVVRLARAKRGRCRWCGYDLRQSPDGCPECGAGRGSTVAGEGESKGSGSSGT